MEGNKPEFENPCATGSLWFASPAGRSLADILLAALARFSASPLKRRRARRTAYQSLQFVARE